MKRDSKQRIGAACKWTELDGTQRPELNFKTSTARYLTGLEPVERHEYSMAVVQHTNKSKLRAHSRTAWHTRTIEYAGRFTEFDLMWEGKDKNLGAAEIARHLTGAI